ncbi:Coiled-coil domain-containing protein 6 [Cichlidogyrus casuarinus]|uniref:Coiled-coil domain-containing protein 6 n=1 Tax=Cichlidogyrus casuarinus TaxID=1844966 RepID=A0ABD2Q757_9PLAT
MTESLPEVDFESDVSSIDGRTNDDIIIRKRIETLHQENSVLKKEVEAYKSRVKLLTEQNAALRRESVNIQARAEQEEEFISNTLLKQITELKKEKESLAINLENEEEYLTNELNRKYTQLKQDRDMLEKTLAKEQEAQISKLNRRIKKLETDVISKQESLEKLRREKIELENALEQEQEALVNRLWKKMEKLETEKKILQERLESTSAPISGSSSANNLVTAALMPPSEAGDGPSYLLRNASMVAVNGSVYSSDKSQLSLADSTSQVSLGSSTQFSRGSSQIPMECDQSAQPSSPHLRTSLGHSVSISDVFGSMRGPNQSQPLGTPGELHISPPNSIHVHNNTNPSTPNADQQPFSRLAASNTLPDSTEMPETGETKSGLDSKSVSQYVQSLRFEVMRLRKIVSKSQAHRGAVMDAYDEEERSIAEENKRLRHMLQSEIERREALSRQFSESESSLEMEDERQFNEARRAHTRFRTSSESASSPPSSGFHQDGQNMGTFGPGHAFAVRMSSLGRDNTVCRECGQTMQVPVPMDGMSSASSSRSRSSRSMVNNNRPKSSSTPSPVLLPTPASQAGAFAHPSGILASLTPTTARNTRRLGKLGNMTQSSSGCVTPSDDELSSLNDPGDFADDADYEDERSHLVIPEIAWHEILPIYSCDLQPLASDGEARGDPLQDISDQFNACMKKDSVKYEVPLWTRLASCGGDTIIRLWKVELDSYKLVKDEKMSEVTFLASLKRHEKPVNVVRWSPSGRYLASGSDDSLVIIWAQKNDASASDLFFVDNKDDDDAEEAKMVKETWFPLRTLRRHLEDVYDVAWSPDDKGLISGSVDHSTILWQVRYYFLFTQEICNNSNYI